MRHYYFDTNCVTFFVTRLAGQPGQQPGGYFIPTMPHMQAGGYFPRPGGQPGGAPRPPRWQTQTRPGMPQGQPQSGYGGHPGARQPRPGMGQAGPRGPPQQGGRPVAGGQQPFPRATQPMHVPGKPIRPAGQYQQRSQIPPGTAGVQRPVSLVCHCIFCSYVKVQSTLLSGQCDNRSSPNALAEQTLAART